MNQNVGDGHLRLGNLDGARASYQESRAHFEAARDMPNVGRLMQAVALTELVAARFQLAEDLYMKSSAICNAAEDRECGAHAMADWHSRRPRRRTTSAPLARIPEGDRRVYRTRPPRGRRARRSGSRRRSPAPKITRARLRLRRQPVAIRSRTGSATCCGAPSPPKRRAARKLGHKDRALGIARAAVAAVNEQQALALDRPGGTVSADAAAAFATLAVLEAEAADAASAFATSESLRAFDIRGGIAVNERDISRGMSADERERERALLSPAAPDRRS